MNRISPLVDHVLARLKNPRHLRADKWEALCPAHPDTHPSLSIEVGEDGRVLLYCHRGCKVEAICQAMGLQVRDLYPPTSPSAQGTRKRRRPSFVFAYVDEHGQLLFQVLRYDPSDPNKGKTFAQRRPNGQGGWIDNIQGVRRVLYRLPEVLNAAPDQWVFFVEGELCADRLAALGVVATTNPMGAKHWDDAYAEPLAGKRVVLLPDNDEAGRVHRQNVVGSVLPRAAELRVVELPGLPEGGDIVDWLDAGHSLADLMQRVEQTSPLSRSGEVVPATPGNHIPEAPDLTQDTQDTQNTQNPQDTQDPILYVGERNSPRQRAQASASLDAQVREARKAHRAIWDQQKQKDPEERDSRLWAFTRLVKDHPEMKNLDAGEALDRVEGVLLGWGDAPDGDVWKRWFELSADEAQTEFFTTWDRIFCTAGDQHLNDRVAQARAKPLSMPSKLKSAGYQVFLTLVWLLQSERDQANVRLSCHAVGSALGVSHDTIARWIGQAVEEDRLALAAPHVFEMNVRKCAEFRVNMAAFPNPKMLPKLAA